MKLIILDRDGVLNQEREDFIKTPEEWVPIDSSMQAVSRLNEAGYRVVLATNQSGIGRGLIDMDTLNTIHQKMHNSLGRFGGWVDAIFFCPDAPDAGSHCRKPNPGMFEDIANRCGTDLAHVPAVGDKLSDIQAAIAAGVRPVLVRTGYGKQTEKDKDLPAGIPIYDDLYSYVDKLLASSS